ncbi:MAG: YraN family protein, partial [Planctomycetota bacterium]
MGNRSHTGRWGERAAERMLRRHGLIVLARNWRGNGGELDLALLEGDTLVFVEVKTRMSGFDDPRTPVSNAQRTRILRAARAFRRRYGVTDRPARFD